MLVVTAIIVPGVVVGPPGVASATVVSVCDCDAAEAGASGSSTAESGGGAVRALRSDTRTTRTTTTGTPAVTVTVTALNPREIRADSTITLTAVVKNTGSTATGQLEVLFERGRLMTTRSDLALADTYFPSTTNAVAHKDMPPALASGLPAGGSASVTYQTTATELYLANLGVYPAAFVVSDVNAGEAEVGRADTFLPYFPAQVQVAPTRVALLWPLLDRPHRLTSGLASAAPPTTAPSSPPHSGAVSTHPQTRFFDDQLGVSVAPGGRLDRLLAVADQVANRVRLTLLIDPETIESLVLMRDGYVIDDGHGHTVAGTHGADATNWLHRLGAVSQRHLLVSTAYGDPDLVALQRAGLSDLIHPRAADLAAINQAIGDVPSTSVAWPPDGQLDNATLDTVESDGASAIVLDASALAGGTGQEAVTPSAVSPLPALGAQAVALVTDSTLQGIVSNATANRGYAGGVRLAEQRYLAELAMITAERPSTARTIVVTPPRRWSPSLTLAHDLAADLGGLSWLSSLSVDDAASVPPVDRSTLLYSPAARNAELPANLTGTIRSTEDLVTDLRSAFSNADANEQLSGYSEALRRAGTSAWRSVPRSGQSYANQLKRQIVGLRNKVRIVTPSNGVYTLASANSPLSLTLHNSLPVPVRIKVKFEIQTAGVTVADLNDQVIPSAARSTLRVPAEVQRTGKFAIRAEVTTPAGGLLGNPVTLTVRSTAYGALALYITGLALAVLVGAVLVRLVRRLRGRPTAVIPGVGTPADRSRL